MPEYPLVLEKLINTPLLAHPDKAMTVAAVVMRRGGVEVNVSAVAENVNAPKPTAGPMQENRLRRRYEAWNEKPFLFADGIAAIEVTGSLAHRQMIIGRSSGITGYDGIGAQFQSAMDDPEVRGIIFDIHSAGGEVSGCFQLADRIFQARGQKPIIALSDEMAFSAAFAIAAACDEIWLAGDTAAVGSVGAALVHVSIEEALKKEGVKPTVFQSGARKMEGNAFQDMPDDVVARWQQRIDDFGAIFERRVARWRGLAPEAVAATVADTFYGQSAVDVGFADGIASPDAVFDALVADTR